MAHWIAWCGFVGGWLLVVGPLDQAIRELQEEEVEREGLVRASQQIGIPPRVSRWWLGLPPVYVVLLRRRNETYKKRLLGVMTVEETAAFAHLRDVATAWAFVAAGALLIAVKETWGLTESYEWPHWVFWAFLVVMLTVCFVTTALRVRVRAAQDPLLGKESHDIPLGKA